MPTKITENQPVAVVMTRAVAPDLQAIVEREAATVGVAILEEELPAIRTAASTEPLPVKEELSQGKIR